MTTATLPEITIHPVQTIECDYLDKENLGWAKAYIAKHRQRLEEGGEDMPLQLRGYLEAEIAAYQDLIERFSA